MVLYGPREKRKHIIQTLTVGGIISNGFRVGLDYFPAIFGALVLWGLTVWIPYLNIGTTVAIVAGLVVAMSKRKRISAVEIFRPEHQWHIGEFLLLNTFIYLGVISGMTFLVIPGVVIFIAWSWATFLLVDRGMDPVAYLSASNQITYGSK